MASKLGAHCTTHPPRHSRPVQSSPQASIRNASTTRRTKHRTLCRAEPNDESGGKRPEKDTKGGKKRADTDPFLEQDDDEDFEISDELIMRDTILIEMLITAGVMGCLGLFISWASHISMTDVTYFSKEQAIFALQLYTPLLLFDAFTMIPDWRRISQGSGGEPSTQISMQGDFVQEVTVIPVDTTQEEPRASESEASMTPAADSTTEQQQQEGESKVKSAVAAAESKVESAVAGESKAESAVAAESKAESAVAAESKVESAVDETAEKGSGKLSSTMSFLNALEESMKEEVKKEEVKKEEVKKEEVKKEEPSVSSQEEKAAQTAAIASTAGTVDRLLAALSPRGTQTNPWQRQLGHYQEHQSSKYADQANTLSLLDQLGVDVVFGFSDVWLHFTLFYAFSHWCADRVSEAGMADSLYLATGIEQSFDVTGQVITGLVFMLIDVTRNLRTAGKLEVSWGNTEIVTFDPRGVATTPIGVPEKDDQANDAEMDEATKVANQKLQALQTRVASQSLKRAKATCSMNGAVSVTQEVLKCFLYGATGTWFPAYCAVFVRQAVFSIYLRIGNERYLTLNANLDELMKNVRLQQELVENDTSSSVPEDKSTLSKTKVDGGKGLGGSDEKSDGDDKAV